MHEMSFAMALFMTHISKALDSLQIFVVELNISLQFNRILLLFSH